MKKSGILIVLLAISSTAMWAQEASKKPEAAKPISPLTWLVGGVWTADTSKLGPEMKGIETRYQWSDNNAFLRFTTHFVMEQRTLKNYDGQFFWDPQKSALGFWYMSAEGVIYEGPVKLRGDVMELTFRGEDFDGKMADLRVTVTRKTNDHYNWLLEEKQADAWKQLLSLEYLRSAS
ncbi:MAG: hypothetical protein WB795_02820 [Candidatus Acidiferrales bacterium]